MRANGKTGRGFRWRRLVWLVVPYAAMLWWVQHMVRDPFNVAYLKQYVMLRCTANLLDPVVRPTPPENLVELERGLRRCQDIEVEVDGVWGALSSQPSVRLKIRPSGEPVPYFKYYSVDVSPMLGIVQVRYELTPLLYYLNL